MPFPLAVPQYGPGSLPSEERFPGRGDPDPSGRGPNCPGDFPGLYPSEPPGVPTLSHEEHRPVIEIAVQAAQREYWSSQAPDPMPRARPVEIDHRGREAGNDASLQVAPYYNKPSAEGLSPSLQEGGRQSRHHPHRTL